MNNIQSGLRCEIIAWVFAILSPAVFYWLPMILFFGTRIEGDWPGVVGPTFFAAMPPMVAAAYIHTKRKSGQSSARACSCSLVATIVAMVVFYSAFWVSAFNSIGVDFGMVFAVMLSPFWMPLITVIAHKLGTEK